jgi:rod shape-determining protein MreD
MSFIAGSSRDLRIRDYRRRFVPAASTLLVSLLAVLPIVVTTPIVPDFAFLVLLAWRLLRPEIWTAQVALGLGLFNDLMAGHPLGQSMALWTILFLACDYVDSRVGFRDYWMDWLLAAAAITLHTLGAWYIAQLMGNSMAMSVLFPQIGLSILVYPIVARLVLALDRWRLAR